MSNITTVEVPSLGESILEATVAKWHKKIGDFLKNDDLLLELETEKITLEVFATTDGTLTKMLATEGQIVKVGQIIAEISKNDTITLENKNNEPKNIAEKKPEQILQVENPEKDPEQNIEKKHNFSKLRTENKIKMSGIRQTIAKRLKSAQENAAILTTFNEVDLSLIISTRQKYQDKFLKKYGLKLGYMSFFIKASAYALKKIPIINSQIDGDFIVEKNYCDIGFAIATDQGLVVPIIKNCESLSIAEIEREISNLTDKTKSHKLSIEDISGGTFTISNGGVFGSLFSTPILNPPQSAILGMHKIQERPVAVNGQVVIKPMMYLALSYDHKLIDGREAVSFLQTIKDYLENPFYQFLEI
jgi:2-oxoglutarate dehydrogenase E2 component (dihydrolipoamide succinyltransferase)